MTGRTADFWSQHRPAGWTLLRGGDSTRWWSFARGRGCGEGQAESAAGDSQPHRRSPKLARLEAALFVAEGALSARKLMQVATLAETKEVQGLIEQLNGFYDAEQSSFRVEKVAGGYRLLTRPAFAAWLDRVHHRQERLQLSSSAMETLTIIAYRQPCTRADVEAVRGVQCSELIKQLMERRLVRVVGEDTSLGRPYLYGTTRLFLESFGLSKLEDLPQSDTLLKRPEPAATEPEEQSGEAMTGEAEAA